MLKGKREDGVRLYSINTLIASTGHAVSQARQKMHWSSLTGSAFFSEAGCPGVSNHSKTPTGHTSIQAPSAMQISKSTATFSPCIPSLLGGSMGPHTGCPSCCSTTCILLLNSGSIGKANHLKIIFSYTQYI